MDNFDFKKRFGQNFLNDNNIIDKIVDGALIDKDTLVIEIGPGGGALSSKIIPRSGFSILYEIDNTLEQYLNNKLRYDNYKIIFGDFLEANVKEDIRQYSFKKVYVVANLPYYITTPIISKFIEDEVFPDKMVIMVQKEVADRLSSKVGSKDYGSLTVFLNYFYDMRKLIDVSRNCFIPKPNVDSAVVVMNLMKDRPIVNDFKLFERLVKDSFQFKRKNLRNNLKKYDLTTIEMVLNKYGYDLSVRAEMLELDIFIEMANKLAEN